MRYMYKNRRPLTHRKRRIRKKHRIGEFTEYGFDVTADLVDGTLSDVADTELHMLVDQIDSRGLSCGGGTDMKSIYLFASPRRRGHTATKEDLAAIHEYLLTREAVKTVQTGPLIDSWG